MSVGTDHKTLEAKVGMCGYNHTAENGFFCKSELKVSIPVGGGHVQTRHPQQARTLAKYSVSNE